MAETPWIIDAWGNLLRPAADAPGNREGESIFGRYGQLEALMEGTKPERLVAEMDAAEVELAGLCNTDAEWVAETCARYPGRFFGMVSLDPRNIMACLRTIERCVRDHGFKAVRIEPFDTSAHVPPFLRTFGQEKCLFASDWPRLPIGRPLGEIDQHCPMPEEVRRKLLHQNAIRAFGLED